MAGRSSKPLAKHDLVEILFSPEDAEHIASAAFRRDLSVDAFLRQMWRKTIDRIVADEKKKALKQ
jgi:hypothetical protein